ALAVAAVRAGRRRVARRGGRAGVRFRGGGLRHRRRRLVAERAGHAAGAGTTVAALLAADLLAAQRRMIVAVGFAGLLGLAEIQVRVDLRAHAAGADQRRQQLLDALGIGVLDARGQAQAVVAGLAGRVRIAGQQPALLVD